jgi:hypothetical protein
MASLEWTEHAPGKKLEHVLIVALRSRLCGAAHYGEMSMNALFKLFGGRQPNVAKIGDVDAGDVARLFTLLETTPTEFAEVNAWTNEVATLLKELVLRRVTDDELAPILAGLLSYRSAGVASDVTQHALIRGFCATNGVLQEILHKVLFSAPVKNADEIDESQFFGRFEANERAQILQTLNDKGYAVLPKRLSPEVVAQLNAAAQKLSYGLRANDKRLGSAPSINADRPPACTTADATEAEFLADPLFAALYRDPQIIGLVEAYLGSPAAPVGAMLRYTFPSAAGSDDCAQTYHYDLDTLRWLKVLYYLNDVGTENGPHMYVEGSQRPGAKSPELLKRHYDRIPDEDILAHQHGAERMFVGPAGSVAIGDTRAWHKGLHVQQGYRLMFLPIYAPSTFSLVHGYAS